MSSLPVRNVEKFELQKHFPKGTRKSVRIIEIFELQRLELRIGNYKSFFTVTLNLFELWRYSYYGHSNYRESIVDTLNDIDQFEQDIETNITSVVLHAMSEERVSKENGTNNIDSDDECLEQGSTFEALKKTLRKRF